MDEKPRAKRKAKPPVSSHLENLRETAGLPAVFVLTYNMPEVAAEWVSALRASVRVPHALYVVDNGSAPQWRYEAEGVEVLRLPRNVRTGGGLIEGWHEAERRGCPVAWAISTSTAPEQWDGDPLAAMLDALADDVAAICPAYSGVANNWPHKILLRGGDGGAAEIPLADPFGLWRVPLALKYADPRLTWSWGLDFEMSHLAHRDGYRLLRHDGVTVSLRENAGYIAGRMGMTHLMREQESRAEMCAVFEEKYGLEWWKTLLPWREGLPW